MKKIILRRNIKGNTSTNNFKYPKAGEVVEALDWESTETCGNGLHGWDENNHTFCSSEYKGNWVVLEVNTKDGFIELGDKVKFRKGKVLYNGKSLNRAKRFLPTIFPVHFDSQISEKDNQLQEAGWDSTQEAGWGSTQKAGSGSTQKAGSGSTQEAGWGSTQKAGSGSTQKAGSGSTQKAGSCSTQEAGSGSTQEAGWDSTHIVRNKCYVTTGLNSTVTHRWWEEGTLKVMVMIVTEDLVNKKLYFENGVITVVGG